MSWGCTYTVRLVNKCSESCSIWRYCAEYKYTIQYNHFDEIFFQSVLYLLNIFSEKRSFGDTCCSCIQREMDSIEGQLTEFLTGSCFVKVLCKHLLL